MSDVDHNPGGVGEPKDPEGPQLPDTDPVRHHPLEVTSALQLTKLRAIGVHHVRHERRPGRFGVCPRRVQDNPQPFHPAQLDDMPRAIVDDLGHIPNAITRCRESGSNNETVEIRMAGDLQVVDLGLRVAARCRRLRSDREGRQGKGSCSDREHRNGYRQSGKSAARSHVSALSDDDGSCRRPVHHSSRWWRAGIYFRSLATRPQTFIRRANNASRATAWRRGGARMTPGGSAALPCRRPRRRGR